MKPRIKMMPSNPLLRDYWLCQSAQFIGMGKTPVAAYEDWLDKVNWDWLADLGVTW